MARNQEKARSMLYKFRQQQLQELNAISSQSATTQGFIAPPDIITAGILPTKQQNPTKCMSIRECEQWRRYWMSMMNKLMQMLNDVALDWHQIRTLNDQLNAVVKDLSRWERRIRQLGGADYKTTNWLTSASALTGGHHVSNGRVLVSKGPDGYLYFGRAKEMPGVKELLQMSITSHDNERDSMSKDEQELLDGQQSLINDLEYLAQRKEDQDELSLICKLEQEHERENAQDFIPTDADINQLLQRVPSLQEMEQFIVEQKKQRLLASLDSTSNIK